MKKIFIPILLFFIYVVGFTQKIPSPDEYLGYKPGERFVQHHELIGYMQLLSQTAPAQVKTERYGTSNENRPLILCIISSAENMARLEEIRKGNLGLAGMGGTTQNNLPAIVWLSYNVHGNEASSSQAVMVTSHYLLTQPRAKEWLKNTVVIIDPCLNPDGYSRYANWFHSVAGDKPNPDPQAREHNEPWPGGRSNHYNFDLNRDWAWQTQVESQARIKKYNEWLPHIHVDFHEQGFNEPYYFAPAAEPFHEVITPWQRKFQTDIGRNHAKYFDKEGWLYFTKERFDLFYPSYGDTWPTYNGSIGMTYEQGGIRAGLSIINQDGDTLTLLDRLSHHHTTGISTVEMASLNAAELVKNFKGFYDNVLANGSGDYKTYVVKRGNNQGKFNRLLQLLDKNGIAYTFSNGGNASGFNYFTTKSESFKIERGDLLISTLQAKGVLARVLFEPNSKLTDSATYDITAWSIPYAYGLESYAVKEKLPGVQAVAVVGGPLMIPNPDTYGYLVRWKSMEEARFLSACLQKGIKGRLAELPFEVGGKKYDAGTLIFLKTSNPGKDWAQQLFDLSEKHRVELEPVSTGFMEKGADFGSPDVRTLLPLKVAMLTGDGTNSLAAGEVWHFFERDLRYPITLINLRDAGSINWSRFQVLILPDGFQYNSLLAKDGALRKWVEQGGRLIALEGAVSALSGNDWGIAARKTPDEKSNDPYAKVKNYGERQRDALNYNNPGSIYRVDLDTTHPLAFGYPKHYFTLKGDSEVYDFTENGWNVGILKKEPRISGFTGSKALEKMKDGVLFGELQMGRGGVVFFADDILFRNFWENGKLLMANAVFFIGQGNGFRL